MRKCVLLFLLFVFVLVIASIIENGEKEIRTAETNQQELALQENSTQKENLP